ncbi:cytochrome c-550 PedF [Limnobacter humi]|uniref:Cytochrome c-550 PedF n=1 Tax=Limnobacter humi TaxID=1778671 RepID=A0ABT1WGY8_9BURK|nr:cytochrome c-550 PedF [Limnobacter humi]MCQ8896654.1 cytochrome c-550 PedF [Limnobacter humi]
MFARKAALAIVFTLASSVALAHGDVVPQAVDVSTLKPLGDNMLDSNPYSGDKEAIRVGSSAYNQNCARCHGLEAVSGGISPDLRKLNDECATLTNKKAKAQCQVDIDSYFRNSVLGGKVRDGRVYMPPFAGIFGQEAIWAIKSYIETRKYE